MRGITHVRSLAFLCATAVVMACHAKAPENPGSTLPESASRALTLDEIAGRIDPGAQVPLSDGFPPWIFELLGLEASPSASGNALLEQSAAEQADLDLRIEAGVADAESMGLVVRAAARSVVLAEQAAKRGATDADALARLERAYNVVDVPLLANDRSIFSQLLAVFAEAGAEGPSDSGDSQQLGEVVQGAIRAAGPLHRRTVAQLLRTAPEHDAIPTALLAVATTQRGDGEDWTIPAAKYALQRRGILASAEEHLELARVCFAGLDLACGDTALRAAAGAEGSDDVEEDAALARRVVELAGTLTLETRLERARAMLKLGRHADAKAEFEALRNEFPGDARPVGGLARHAVATDLDFDRAHQIIDGQEGLENGDAEYYELAIGARAMVAISVVMPALAADEGHRAARVLRSLVPRMRADIDGYTAAGNLDARYLGWVLDIGEELLAQYDEEGSVSLRDVRSLGERAVKLQQELHGNPHVYRLLMSVSLFEADKSRAVKMAGVSAPAGPDHDVLALRRARALVDLAVAWGDGSLATQALDAFREVDASSSPEAAELYADALMVQRILGGVEPWVTIVEGYERLLDESMTPEDARMVNNVAFAMMNFGAPKELADGARGELRVTGEGARIAQEAWTVSSMLSEDHGDVARLNLIVLATPDGDAAAVGAMRTLAQEATLPGVRITALAWIQAWSKGKAAQRKAAVALEAALEEAKADGPRPTVPDPYSGVVLEGSLEAGLAYTVERGLQIELDSSGRPWAILAPPGNP